MYNPDPATFFVYFHNFKPKCTLPCSRNNSANQADYKSSPKTGQMGPGNNGAPFKPVPPPKPKNYRPPVQGVSNVSKFSRVKLLIMSIFAIIGTNFSSFSQRILLPSIIASPLRSTEHASYTKRQSNGSQ